MRILVLGAGLQGSACAFDLLCHGAAVTLGDSHPRSLPGFLDRFRSNGQLNVVQLDVREEEKAVAVMTGHDAILSALPYYYNFDAARLAVGVGAHFADLGGNTEIVWRQKELHDAAVGKGITVRPDCGLAPGMVNILAADGISRFEQVTAARLYVGGLPQDPEPPLNYQIVYSLEGALDYYTTLSWVLRHGRPTEVEALSEVETIEFPEPLGGLEAFHTAGGLSTMPWDYEGRVPVMEYKTLRYPGHAHIMRAIRDLGLLDTDPVQVYDVAIRPRDAFIAIVDPKLRKPNGHDLVALKVVVQGRRNGRDGTVTYELIDRFDRAHGLSAMARTTAFSLSITGQLQVAGHMGPPGVMPAYGATPAAEYMQELEQRGIHISVEEY